MKKILEIIAISSDDVALINESKADRIELVYDLPNGGLSPTLSTIKESVKLTNIPINVMVRSQYRSFIYTDDELAEMLIYIKKINELEDKPNGIVFGSINKNKSINEEQLKKVIEVKGDLELVFHRAFDESKDYKSNIEILKKYKEVKILLTSGTKPKAIDAKEELK
jgi:copper homeostasis protein